jgi:transposase
VSDIAGNIKDKKIPGFTISKIRAHGHTYLRTQESYRDEYGIPRHRNCQYIGKVDHLTGKNIYYPDFIEKVRGTELEPPDMRYQKIHSDFDLLSIDTRYYGAHYILNHVSKTLGLEDALSVALPDKYLTILDLAMYFAINGDPAMYCEFWQDETFSLSTKTLTSHRISDLLISITEEERMDFYSNWAETIAATEYFALDCSSISSYSELIDEVNWGYNKDNEKLPQVNLCMLAGEQSRTPVFPLLYDGSIKDVSILPSMLSIASHISLDNLSIVTDRGFYSKSNINKLFKYNSKFRFLSSVPFTTKFSKEQVERVRNVIDLSERTIQIGKLSIKGISNQVMWDSNHELNVHVFHNQHASLTAETTLDLELAKLRDSILSGEKNVEKSNSLFKFLKIIKSNEKNTIPIIKYNYPAINNKNAYSGWMVVVSNSITIAKEAIQIYRAKDVIEKCFYMIKNLLDFDRIRCHSEEAMHNKLFIIFISLIFLSYVHRVMIENDLYKNYTMKELFKIMEKHKTVQLKGVCQLLPATATQKRIYSAFGLSTPE